MMNDTISRQAAIEELREMAIALYGYDSTSVISCAIYKLQNLPSAEQHGRWINDNHLIKCSICGKPIPLRRIVLHNEVMWEDNNLVKYCPYCGAKMEDTKDE